MNRPRRPMARRRATSVPNRRRALQRLALAAAAPVVLAATTRRSQAELPVVAESGLAATSLGYRHDATTVDTSDYPHRTSARMICSNCRLYEAMQGSGWGQCALFPGRRVNGAGWCSAWVGSSV